MPGSLNRKITNLKAEAGLTYIDFSVSGAGAHTGNWEFILPEVDTTISSIVSPSTDGDSLVGKVLAAGIPVPIKFVSIAISAGRAFLVKKNSV